jgi:hypothetical protein
MVTKIERGKKDWHRGWQEVTLMPSAVHTEEANVAGDTFDLGDWDQMMAVLDITASATDAADTLDVYIDISFDAVQWINAVHFTQQAGNGAAARQTAALNSAVAGVVATPTTVTADAASGVVRPGHTGRYVRVRSTVVRDTGTDESHTFSVRAVVK